MYRRGSLPNYSWLNSVSCFLSILVGFEINWISSSSLEDEFKPHSDEGSSEDEVSSGVDEDKISEPETESEIDSPVKVWIFLSYKIKLNSISS